MKLRNPYPDAVQLRDPLAQPGNYTIALNQPRLQFSTRVSTRS